MDALYTRPRARRRILQPTSFRLDPDVLAQFDELATRYPLFNKSDMIENALRFFLQAVAKGHGELSAHCFPVGPEADAIIKAA